MTWFFKVDIQYISLSIIRRPYLTLFQGERTSIRHLRRGSPVACRWSRAHALRGLSHRPTGKTDGPGQRVGWVGVRAKLLNQPADHQSQGKGQGDEAEDQGPKKPKHCPAWISKEIWPTATRSWKRLVRFSALITGSTKDSSIILTAYLTGFTGLIRLFCLSGRKAK